MNDWSADPQAPLTQDSADILHRQEHALTPKAASPQKDWSETEKMVFP